VYKPNFCADCGERVLRERWRAWTSRRFCPACESRFRRGWFAPLVFACALVASGFAVGRFMRPAPPPLVFARGELPVPAVLAKNLSGATNNPTGGAATGETAGGGSASGDAARQTDATNGAANADSTRAGLGVAASEPPTDPNEVVSICGARTKKGTPCQRRVRGTGRCWQHLGMPAIIPLEKRIVQGTP
jgi:hypothetical protein